MKKERLITEASTEKNGEGAKYDPEHKPAIIHFAGIVEHHLTKMIFYSPLLSISCFALDLFKCDNAYHFSSSGPCYREQVIHGKDRLCVVQAMSSHNLLCFACSRHYSRYLRRREVMQLSSGHVDIRSKCSLELGGGTTGV